MKTLFMILISLFVITSTYASPKSLWSDEKCNATEQVPDALTPGTIARVMVVSSEESQDVVLILEVKETGEFKSLPMTAIEGTEAQPRWESGDFKMDVDFNLGQYHIYKFQKKILTLDCNS